MNQHHRFAAGRYSAAHDESARRRRHDLYSGWPAGLDRLHLRIDRKTRRLGPHGYSRWLSECGRCDQEIYHIVVQHDRSYILRTGAGAVCFLEEAVIYENIAGN